MIRVQSELTGWLAQEYGGHVLPIEVLHSARGFYLGTADELGPISRESEEYWEAHPDAVEALIAGRWTQRGLP